jgi:hypothetical protein
MPEPDIDDPGRCPANPLGTHAHDIDPHNLADLGRRFEPGLSGAWFLVTCIHCHRRGRAFVADRDVAWEEPG